MSMSVIQMRDRVNYLLEQDTSTSATKFVSDTQIIAWLQEAMDFLCVTGKIWEVRYTITSGTISTIAYPTTTVSGSGRNCEVLEVINVENTTTGEALTYMDQRMRGKWFETGTTPMWWWTFGQTIYIYPTGATAALAISFYARSTDTIVASGASSGQIDGTTSGCTFPFPSRYEYLLPIYAAFRGKQAYHLYDEATGLLQKLSADLGLNIEDVKSRLGVPSAR